MSNKCKLCNELLRKLPGFKKIVRSEKEAKVLSESTDKEVRLNDTFCSNCWRRASVLTYCKKQRNRLKKSFPTASTDLRKSPVKAQIFDTTQSNLNHSDFMDQFPQNKRSVLVPFQRTAIATNYCIVCQRRDNLHTIPLKKRLQVFAEKQIFIPKGDCCCDVHLVKEKLHEDDLSRLQVVSFSSSVEKGDFASFFKLWKRKPEPSLIETIDVESEKCNNNKRKPETEVKTSFSSRTEKASFPSLSNLLKRKLQSSLIETIDVESEKCNNNKRNLETEVKTSFSSKSKVGFPSLINLWKRKPKSSLIETINVEFDKCDNNNKRNPKTKVKTPSSKTDKASFPSLSNLLKRKPQSSLIETIDVESEGSYSNEYNPETEVKTLDDYLRSYFA